jgi:hypothetical protein
VAQDGIAYFGRSLEKQLSAISYKPSVRDATALKDEEFTVETIGGKLATNHGPLATDFPQIFTGAGADMVNNDA